MQMAYTGLRQQRAALRVPNNWWEVYYLVEAVWQLILFFLSKIQQARFVYAHGAQNALHLCPKRDNNH
jgi:hypothetical protein